MLSSGYQARWLILVATLLQLAIGATLCYHEQTYRHSTPSHKHHNHYLAYQSHDHDKRQTNFESTNYKKTVTVQNNNDKPVETSYSWSSSSGQEPPLASEASGESSVSQVIRRITTSTSSEANSISDSTGQQATGGQQAPNPNNEPRSPDASQAVDSNNVENFSYNITIIREIDGLPKSSNRRPDVCPQNKFGNVVIGCKDCQCNGNIDLTARNNCDPTTGKCLRCLYNTAGDHCEICRDGYSGNANTKSCGPCVCNKLGTQPNKTTSCHPTTGQCACLPHVEGADCGKCRHGYYNLASAEGCRACECDPAGTRDGGSCNEFDGKCDCLTGFAGRQCNECPLGSHGNPKLRCQACQCNRDGSVDLNCDTKSGKCRCQPGIGGDRCDRCARGYHGRFPNCEHCGECFDQWDAIVGQLKNDTQSLLDRVKLLLEIGTNGPYKEEFNKIESNLDRIKYILDNQRLNEDDIRDLARQVEELAKLLKKLEKTLASYEIEANDISNRTAVVQEALRDYEKLAERITILINGLHENATTFQAANVDGAYAIILDSQNRSREAEKKVKDLKPIMLEQEQKRRQTEIIFSSTIARYNSSNLQNEAILSQLSRQIYELEQNVPRINGVICQSSATVDTCDQLCGGALCDKCGGLSCSEGATTKASNALDLAQQAMDLINQKYNLAKLDLEALNEARNMSEEALRQAKQVLADCQLQKSKFDKIGQELNGIMDGVDKFYLIDGARPAEVRTLGTECLALSISLKPEQILDLARKINETISSLTNIDKILADTAGDLKTAEQLHQQADRAKEAADNVLETVEAVLNMLRLAAIEQAKAAAAIAAAQANIEGAQADLAEITAETERLVAIVGELADAIKKLQDRLNELRKKYAQNELYVTQAKLAAEDASKLADQAEKDTNLLEDKVRLAEEKLRNKTKQNGELRDRAERLKNDAHQLAGDISARMNLLRELDDLFDDYVKRVKDYQNVVDDLHRRMNEYLVDIDKRAQHYRDCQT